MVQLNGAVDHATSPFFFPRADSLAVVLDPTAVSAEPPEAVGPVFDQQHANEPLLPFDRHVHESVYGKDPTGTPEADPPPQPESFHNAYLFPSLTRNERLRLTVLWYYTRLVTRNDQLMAKLQDMITLVQKFMGWEFAIVGILDEAVYTRLATANLPLGKLPRRESTCSHTINQTPGSVFSVTNMAEDWRFQSSPHVKIGGLRSYAGTQLRLQTSVGEEVALGSLCIASNTVQKPLTPEQKVSLVSFAAMFTNELVTAMRQNRLGVKQEMTEMLMELQSQEFARRDDFEAAVTGSLRTIYPSATLSIYHTTDNVVRLTEALTLPFSALHAGLWEDTALIDEAIKSENHCQLGSTKVVRAMAGKCGRFHIFVVVASSEVRHVFDDYDLWFVDRCAELIGDYLQQQRYQDALRAKEAFLRCITHQLRTPIHGVLTSSELLAEELASRNGSLKSHNGGRGDTAMCYVSTIQRSGTELMSTVNGILKLNSWARHKAENIKPKSYDLRHLEAHVMSDLFAIYPDYHQKDVSICFEIQLGDQESVVTIDPILLKAMLQPLVINAIQACAHGTVKVTIKAEKSSLQLEVIDNGSGIPLEDQTRIFEPFEKGSVHARGAGLGLTLAHQDARSLGGSLSLVKSREGVGSHFRILLPGISFSAGPAIPPTENVTKSLPKRFHVLSGSGKCPTLLSHLVRHLLSRGFTKSVEPQGSLIIMEKPTDNEPSMEVLKSLQEPHMIICVTLEDVPPSGVLSNVKHLLPHHQTFAVSGPFYSTRLDQVLSQADRQWSVSSTDPPRKMASTDTTSTIQSTHPENIPLHDLSISPPATKSAPALKALLVDDNSVNLRVLRMYCEKRGIPFLLATDGDAAIEQFKAAAVTEPVDLVLMDLEMPRCDGLGATAGIRAYEKANSLKPCTVFMVTGQDSPGDRLNSFEVGANEYFVKPVSLKQLDKEIARYFPKA
ncbi:hypothetical protein PV05_00877 [Exophiala xenobiotica]|uniref:histidine kinase n=1 Tax=Exophiala xenobiotica TaxID=348802 RepID=A0A0D2DED1_9EURO|nr:uncharacterized protein PV05_00877 [Exophiala xenobiotica]KIW60677.1 hypothetical protein PV05_00877 [Exophiala xenobiotica]